MEIENPSDSALRQLIEKCCQNDRKSQEILYKKYYPSMFRVCLRYAGNREDAAEILNSGFLKVFMNLHTFSFQGVFEGWLQHIMVNTALDKIKAGLATKQQTVSVEDYTAYENEVSVENTAMKSISSESVLRFVGQLPPMSRSVFNMYVFEGFSHREISQTLGIKEGTSHWHLLNARNILKEKINEFNQ
jgi:RNA polymerase sigma factor (sigma-70 family)